MDNNKVFYGICNAHYALMSLDENGVPTYETPVVFEGSVGLNLSAEGGDPTPFFADNITYFMSPAANNGYSGDWEVALVHDHFKKAVLGYIEDAKGKLMEIGEATSKTFALLFEFDGDQNKTRHVLYNCQASRGDFGSETTQETVEPRTETLTITSIPQKFTTTIEGQEGEPDTVITHNVVKASVDPACEEYDTWFSAVPVPEFSAEA